MRGIIILLSVLVLAFSLAGCGSNEEDGKINLPIGANDYKDANYQDIVAKFENAGFTNVQTVALDDLVLGWFNKDGEVKEVSVDGYTSFSTDSRYPAEAEIIVTYHSFPADEVEETAESSTPESIVQAEPTKNTQPTQVTQSTEEIQPTVETQPTEEILPPEVTQPTEDTQPPAVEEIITVDNNAEFAAVLNAKDPGDPIIKEFAEKYVARIIEFDGNIADMANYYADSTRYDFLIFPWDWNENSSTGPNFKFENCSILDLHLTGDNIPDTIGRGANLHFTARIFRYEEISQLFYLDPISTEVR